MVPLNGIPLIFRNIGQWSLVDDFSIYVVSGYMSDSLSGFSPDLIVNPLYNESNMVWSLLMALPCIESLNSEFIYVSYGDIVVASRNIELLTKSEAKVSILIDTAWEALWSLRMENPIDDIESLKLSGSRITEIGQTVTSEDDVEGQYIGVLKVDRLLLVEMLMDYRTWVESSPSHEVMAKRRNLYLTDFIQRYIDISGEVTAVLMDGGWLEVDSAQDLEIYERNWSKDSIFGDLV